MPGSGQYDITEDALFNEYNEGYHSRTYLFIIGNKTESLEIFAISINGFWTFFPTNSIFENYKFSIVDDEYSELGGHCLKITVPDDFAVRELNGMPVESDPTISGALDEFVSRELNNIDMSNILEATSTLLRRNLSTDEIIELVMKRTVATKKVAKE
jgi:hypothetical protein